MTDAAGFPLMVEAFEGNTAETTTMLPTIRAFITAHQLADVTIVADAGMIAAGNKQAIEAAQMSFILGTKIPDIPYVVAQWRRRHPDEQPADGLILTQPWPAGPTDQRRDQVIYYQYRADRARRSLHGIDEQVAKAEPAVAGKAPVKRNRFIHVVGADKSVNRTLEAKARAAGRMEGLHHQPRHLPRRHIDGLLAELANSETTEALQQLDGAVKDVAEYHSQAPARQILSQVTRLHRQLCDFKPRRKLPARAIGTAIRSNSSFIGASPSRARAWEIALVDGTSQLFRQFPRNRSPVHELAQHLFACRAAVDSWAALRSGVPLG